MTKRIVMISDMRKAMIVFTLLWDAQRKAREYEKQLGEIFSIKSESSPAWFSRLMDLAYSDIGIEGVENVFKSCLKDSDVEVHTEAPDLDKKEEV